MKASKLLSLTFFISVLLFDFAYSQKYGKIKGTVSDTKGKKLPYVSVYLKETTIGAATDNSGKYIITKVPSGKQVIIAEHMGFKDKKKSITVKEGETVKVNFILKEKSGKLQPVEITGRREISYKNGKTFSATKTEMKVKNVPQSISSVNKELIKDQKAYRLNDVVKNVAGANQFSVYDDITIRGFRNWGNVRLLNGMRFQGNFWASPLLVNIERVEVIKGPSSVTFGGNINPGGTINMVTKKPLTQQRMGIDFTVGSFNTLRTTADFTGPINEDSSLLYRLNLGYEDAGSFRDKVFNNSIAIAPSVSFLPSEDTRVNFDITYFNNKTILDRGRPVFKNDQSLISTPKGTSLSQEGDVLNPVKFAAVLSFNHQFTDNISFSTSLSRFKEDIELREHRFSKYVSDKVVQLKYNNRQTNMVADNLSSYFNLDLNTGPLKHKVMIGFDYAHLNQVSSQATSDSVMTMDLRNVVNIKRPVNNYELNAQGPSKSEFTNFGYYLQDIIEFNKFTFVGSLRRDHYIVPEELTGAADSLGNDNQTALVPRIGLTYKLTPAINIYGTFNQGYQPVSPSKNLNPVFGGPFDPITSRLWEVGAKGEFFNNRLLATFSVYDLTKNNVLVNANNPQNPDLLEQRGQERARGAELEANGRILPNLSVSLNYAYNFTRITESDEQNEDMVGLIKENAPRHASGSWIKYTVNKGFLDGLGIALGHSHNSRRRTFDKFSNGDWLYIPSYVVFNGAISYKVNQFEVSFNLNNITDETYWIGAYNFERNFLGAPRNYMLSVGYNF